MKDNQMLNRIIVIIIVTLAVISGGLFINILNNMQEEETFKEEETIPEYTIWIPSSLDEEIVKSMYTSYDEKRLGVKFKVMTFSEEVYDEALITSSITNSLPDMFYVDDALSLKKLVDIGSIMDLSDYIKSNQFEKDFVEDAIEDFTINDKIYGLPFMGNVTVLYCNRNLFEACDIEYPRSYKDFIECIKIFKQKNVIPLSLGGASANSSMRYYHMLIEENQSIVESAKALEKIIKLEPFHTTYYKMSEDDAAQSFANGESAMFLGTSYEATRLEQVDSSIIHEAIDIVPCPTVNENKVRIGDYTCGFVLNQNSTLNKSEEIKAFYENFVRNLSWEMTVFRGKGLPVYKHQNNEKIRFRLLNECNRVMLDYNQEGVYKKMLKELSNKKIIKQYNEGILRLMQGQVNTKSFLTTLGL